MLNKLKSYIMPIAMGTGIIFYDWLGGLGFITPWLAAIMLLISFCDISLKEVRVTKLHIWLISIQIAGSFILYNIIYPFHPVIAQAAMICVLAPTATSAIVITGMLGGNTSSLAAYTLVSNMAVAIFAPLGFVLIGYKESVSFWESFFLIFGRVFLILLFPFIISQMLRRFFPLVSDVIWKKQSFSFYLWTLALMIVTGRTVKFILSQEGSVYMVGIIIAIISFVICLAQFFAGRRLGRKYHDTVAGGQGLGQKNTVLSIWMAQTYLNPISSLGPGAYVLWQNMVNSYQLWKKRKK